jgi:hypothetical protein
LNAVFEPVPDGNDAQFRAAVAERQGAGVREASGIEARSSGSGLAADG